jgi:hypothetical protein
LALIVRRRYGDLAFEHSITRNWVAAMDFWFEQDNPAPVSRINTARGTVGL